MKRLYKHVSQDKKPEGWTILLDGRAIKTRAGGFLYAQNEDIAKEIAEEWNRQKDKIDPDSMPFTQILNTRIDQVTKNRNVISEMVLRYLDTDLICYLAETPKDLNNLQEHHWKKWRDWAKEFFGYPVLTTSGLDVLEQTQELHNSIATHIDKMSDDMFTLLQVSVPLSGSLILGLALIEGKADAQDVFKACFVEEHYKDEFYRIDEYGRDPFSEHKQKACLKDLQACERYRRLLIRKN
ncbi:MAG: ATP12 family protein [Alphaproteobacteria bacterium]